MREGGRAPEGRAFPTYRRTLGIFPTQNTDAGPFRRSDPDTITGKRKGRTMKEKKTDRESTLSELYRISEQLDSHRDRLQGMGLLIDAELSYMHDNIPTEKTLESLRAIINDRIERESEIIEGLMKKLDAITATNPEK